MLSRQQHTGVLETIEPPTLRPQPNNIAVLWLNHGKSIVSRVAAGSGLGRFCGGDVAAICPLGLVVRDVARRHYRALFSEGRLGGRRLRLDESVRAAESDRRATRARP